MNVERHDSVANFELFTESFFCIYQNYSNLVHECNVLCMGIHFQQKNVVVSKFKSVESCLLALIRQLLIYIFMLQSLSEIQSMACL